MLDKALGCLLVSVEKRREGRFRDALWMGGGKDGTRVVGWISVFEEGHLECKKFRVYHM